MNQDSHSSLLQLEDDSIIQQNNDLFQSLTEETYVSGSCSWSLKHLQGFFLLSFQSNHTKNFLSVIGEHQQPSSSSIISLSSSTPSNYGGIGDFFSSQSNSRNSTPQSRVNDPDLQEEEDEEERITLIPEIDFEGINLDNGDNRESQPLLGGGSGGCTNARGCETDEHSFNHFPGKFKSSKFSYLFCCDGFRHVLISFCRF